MYERERALSDIGAYDDYRVVGENEIEGEDEGFFRPLLTCVLLLSSFFSVL